MSCLNFYHSRRWRRLRRAVLSEHGYRCQNCLRYGRAADAVTAHHVNPLEERPDLAYAPWNLIALCEACHNRMHDRVTGKLTALGEQWRQRVSPPPEDENGQTLGTGEG